MQQSGAGVRSGPRQSADRRIVDRPRPIRLVFGEVHRRVRGRIDDPIGPGIRQRPFDGMLIGDVEIAHACTR